MRVSLHCVLPGHRKDDLKTIRKRMTMQEDGKMCMSDSKK